MQSEKRSSMMHDRFKQLARLASRCSDGERAEIARFCLEAIRERPAEDEKNGSCSADGHIDDCVAQARLPDHCRMVFFWPVYALGTSLAEGVRARVN
jgi:hypothetical protein